MMKSCYLQSEFFFVFILDMKQLRIRKECPAFYYVIISLKSASKAASVLIKYT